MKREWSSIPHKVNQNVTHIINSVMDGGFIVKSNGAKVLRSVSHPLNLSNSSEDPTKF